MRRGASGSGGWQARRDLVNELFSEVFQKLETMEMQPRGPRLEASSLAGLTDPAVIQEHLDRLQRAINDDLALAIGSAKELIESTAKTVLIERGTAIDERTDLPALVKEAQQALGLHPSSATLGPDGTEAVRKILGGVSSIAIGVAELRNRGYGTGHGGAGGRTGLSKRHAHLAVNAANHVVPTHARYARRLCRSMAANLNNERTKPFISGRRTWARLAEALLGGDLRG